jgi:hypothetical protein
MARFPSKEELDAMEETLQPYFVALGKVAHEWNHLHEELGKVFCAVIGLDLSIGLAAWHSLNSDRSKRKMLRDTIRATSSNEDWQNKHPGAYDGVIYLISETDKLAERRNDAIHAPCTAMPWRDFEVTPLTFFGNKRAKSLRGKQILREFSLYEKTAAALKRHATECRFALDAQVTWPERPQLPSNNASD